LITEPSLLFAVTPDVVSPDVVLNSYLIATNTKCKHAVIFKLLNSGIKIFILDLYNKSWTRTTAQLFAKYCGLFIFQKTHSSAPSQVSVYVNVELKVISPSGETPPHSGCGVTPLSRQGRQKDGAAGGVRVDNTF